MSPQEIYSRFLIKINRNNTGANRTCDKGRFIVLINEAKNRWVDQCLEDKNSILIDDREKNIREWEKAGGIGILHTSTKDTLRKLKRIID